MRNSLISLGVCETEEDIQEILEDKIPKSLKRFVGKYYKLDKHSYFKRVVKPPSREGHSSVYMDGNVYVFGGMTHVLCLNDCYKIGIGGLLIS